VSLSPLNQLAKGYVLRGQGQNVLVFYSDLPVYNPQMRTGFKPYKQVKGHHGTNYGSDRGAVTESNGERYPLTTIYFQRDKEKRHPTQKPVALFEYLIRTYTNPGMTVLDNCAGSGTTALAAINSGRSWVCIEKDVNYAEIAIERINASRMQQEQSNPLEEIGQ